MTSCHFVLAGLVVATIARVSDAAALPVDLVTSTTFAGWPAANAIDRNEATSWFSARDDSAAKGKEPFFEVRFSEPRVIHSVEVMGNRDPSWPTGFSILAGRLEVFDSQGRSLARMSRAGVGEKKDFQFELSVEGATRVRFTSLEDEGDQNNWGDVAIGELVVR